MKKIFTLFGGMLLASTLNTNAMEVEVYVKDADSYITQLTKDADGNFVLADFLESEKPISFKFEKPTEVYGKGAITITSKTEEDAPYYDLLDENGDPIDCFAFNYKNSGDWLSLYYPSLYNKIGNTFVQSLEPEEYDGYEYYAKMTIFAYDETLNENWIYVSFYFNDPSEANQAAYKKVIEQIEAVEEEYNDAVAQIKEVNPEFDFVTDGWTEIASMLSSAKGYALMELNAANSDLADFNFAYTGEDEQGFIIEMKKAAFKEPNQKAYDDAVAELDELLSKYNAVMEDAKAKNPDYDFEGNDWLAVGSQIEQYKNFAAQALSMADEAGEYFKNVFYFDASEIEGMIEEMKKAVDDGTTGIGAIEAEVAAGNAKIFTLDGKSHNAPVKGQVNVIVKENSTVKVMVK